MCRPAVASLRLFQSAFRLSSMHAGPAAAHVKSPALVTVCTNKTAAMKVATPAKWLLLVVLAACAGRASLGELPRV